jgi:hypothetical protein
VEGAFQDNSELNPRAAEMHVLYRYLLIFAACAALLLGIQVPAFVDQYDKRLDAHLQEVQANLKGYREIAERDFGGSMEALIRRHKDSSDPVFRDEAAPIETMYLRFLHFDDQRKSLDTILPKQVLFLALHADRDLLRETYDSYGMAVPLDGTAIYSGFAAVALVVLLLELVASVSGVMRGLGARSRSRF